MDFSKLEKKQLLLLILIVLIILIVFSKLLEDKSNKKASEIDYSNISRRKNY